MIQSIQHGTIVEMLLNSLEAERYVRGPLLLNVVDELANDASFAPAAEMARGLLSRLEAGSITDGDFRARLSELRTCVQRLAMSGGEGPSGGAGPSSGVTVARTAPRLYTGRRANAA